MEHSTLCAALPPAAMEVDARGGAMRCDNALRGATTEGVQELDELHRDSHVAHEENQSPMRGGVEELGDIKGQGMILFLAPL